MLCSKCGSDKSRVTHTRAVNTEDESYVERRRVCRECGYAWWTREDYRVGAAHNRGYCPE